MRPLTSERGKRGLKGVRLVSRMRVPAYQHGNDGDHRATLPCPFSCGICWRRIAAIVHTIRPAGPRLGDAAVAQSGGGITALWARRGGAGRGGRGHSGVPASGHRTSAAAAHHQPVGAVDQGETCTRSRARPCYQVFLGIYAKCQDSRFGRVAGWLVGSRETTLATVLRAPRRPRFRRSSSPAVSKWSK